MLRKLLGDEEYEKFMSDNYDIFGNDGCSMDEEMNGYSIYEGLYEEYKRFNCEDDYDAFDEERVDNVINDIDDDFINDNISDDDNNDDDIDDKDIDEDVDDDIDDDFINDNISDDDNNDDDIDDKDIDEDVKDIRIVYKDNLDVDNVNVFMICKVTKKGEHWRTIIDKKSYDHIQTNVCSIRRNDSGYAIIYINGKGYRLNRYIYYVIYGNKEPKIKMKIDHINGKRLDNRITNLREVTSSENNTNKSKSSNATSKYYGVSKSHGLWWCDIKINGVRCKFSYKNELHAAYHYNLLVIENNMTFKKLNVMEEPEGFVRKERYGRKSDLPLGICRKGKKFRYKFKGKQSRGFNTIKEAECERNKNLEEERLEKEDNVLNSPIKRDEKGVAIIELLNKRKEVVGTTQISDNKYRDVLWHSWSFSSGYVCGKVNGKSVMLSRYIMGYDESLYVDHIDGNPLNNQTENLRLANPKQNSQNRCASKNSTSGYVGVHYHKRDKLWIACVSEGGKEIWKKYCKTQNEAALMRDKYVMELNATTGSCYRLNFADGAM